MSSGPPASRAVRSTSAAWRTSTAVSPTPRSRHSVTRTWPRSPRHRSIFLAAPVDDAGDLQARSAGAWSIRTSSSRRPATRLDLIGIPIRDTPLVELQGAGSRHSGNYFVGGVRHTIDADSYRMELELLRNALGRLTWTTIRWNSCSTGAFTGTSASTGERSSTTRIRQTMPA